MASEAPGDVPMPPFGSLLLAPAGLQVLASGELPGAVSYAVPIAATLAGEDLWLSPSPSPRAAPSAT